MRLRDSQGFGAYWTPREQLVKLMRAQTSEPKGTDFRLDL